MFIEEEEAATESPETPAHEMTEDDLARKLLADLEPDEPFVWWLERHGFLDEGQHQPYIEHREPGHLSFTTAAILLLHDVWQGERQTATQHAAAERAATERREIQAAFQTTEAESRARIERERIDREREEREERRTTLAADLQGPSWRNGEDAMSLRALVVWSRLNSQTIKFNVTDPALFAALRAAGQELNKEIDARESEISKLEAANKASRIARATSGEASQPVPSRIDIRTFLDPDAVARWLSAHRGAFELLVGKWQYEDLFEDAVKIGSRLRLYPSDGWDVIRERWARWQVCAQIEREQPEQNEGTRSLILDILLESPQALPRPLQEELADAVAALALAPRKPDSEEDADDDEAAPDPQLANEIEAAIIKFNLDKGHGPRRIDLERRITARHDRLTGALTWLTREGGSIVKRRRNRADEYCPVDEV